MLIDTCLSYMGLQHHHVGLRPEREKIAEKILGAAVVGTTIMASPLAGTALFFLGIAGLTYLFRKADFTGWAAGKNSQKGPEPV